MEYIIMNRKELQQSKIFEQVKSGLITQKVAAAQLHVTTRWVREKIKRFKEFGDNGITHRSRGKVSSRKWNIKEQATLFNLLDEKWKDFGPTFASEKLQELYSIKVSKETVRKVMIEKGFWYPKINRVKHRHRRERRPMRGMMVQLDGSPHDWFEGRAGKCTLIVFIDDATSEILWLEFAPTESMQALMQATKNYVEKHGAPQSFYTDHGSVFHVNTNNAEGVKKTDWEIAVAQLGIQVIHANSPQAKGRVERCNQTMQDRLVKEMRMLVISSIEEANFYLQNSNFIAQHNQKRSEVAFEKGDAHRSTEFEDLIGIFSTKEIRILCNDYTISYNKQIFQLHKQNIIGIRPKDKIVVQTDLQGNISLILRGVPLFHNLVMIRPKAVVPEKIIVDKAYKPNNRSSLFMGRQYASFNQESRVKTALTAVESE